MYIMYKKVILFLLILLLSVNFAAASDNSTIDDADVPHVSGNDFESIRDTINNVEENGVVELNGTYHSNDGYINIYKSVTLQGSEKGAVLDFEGYGAFRIYDSNVTLKNLKFVNTEGSSTMVFVSNSNLTVINCTFEDISYYAIDFQGYSLIVDGCEFSNSNYCGITSDADNVLIKNSVFTEHEEGCIGGFSKKLTVEDCMFMNLIGYSIGTESDEVYLNRNLFKNSYEEGGSARLFSNKSSVKNCIFDGPGSLIVFSTSEILNCNFTNGNLVVVDPVKVNVKGSVFKGGSHVTCHDDIVKNINIINNEFDGNCIRGEFSYSNMKVINNTVGGSFVYIENDDLTKVSITNSQFSNNVFKGDMFVSNSYKDVVFNNNIFSNNTCKRIAYLDFEEKGTVQITNNIFSNNLDGNGDLAQITMSLYYEEYMDSNYEPMVKYLTKEKIGNNFLGFNVQNDYDLENVVGIEGHNASWINVEFKQVSLVDGNYTYSLNFIDRNGKVYKLPAYNFKIQDKKTGNILVDNIQIKDGKATFSYNKKLSLDDIFILTEAGNVVNRPKAEITIKRTGTTFDDTKITVSLSYQGKALKNQVVNFDIYEYETAKSKYIHESSSRTNSNGVATLDYDLDVSRHHYDIKAMYASKDFSQVSVTIKNIKVKTSNVIFKTSKVVTTYKSGKTLDVKVLDAKTKKPVKNCGVDVYLRKGSINYCYVLNSDSNGMVHAPVSTFGKLGTFNVFVECGDENHVAKTVKTTFTLNKAKTTVNIDSSVKKSSSIKITVKNKATNKPANNVKVTVKVYTGKSYKTYNLKANYNGIAYISANKLSLGTHKVVVSSNDEKYTVSKSANVKIVK